MRSFYIFLLFLLFSTHLCAQKIGLVLSGGGAKGIMHIGVIKALEENNIPIDYITGTSIGSIVGGLYSMGLSPDEIIEIFKSPDFKKWSTGVIDPNEKYYYFNDEPRPSILDLKFKITSLDSFKIRPNILPQSYVSPNQMNLAFITLFAPGTAAADYNFDNLMVPFRCVASDVFNKRPVIFSNGNLGDAIRASMSYPFMYKPIRIDGNLLFDGGIYNNFPVNVMRKDFKPDYIIGSIVANNPNEPDDNDIISQISNMIINRTDYSLDPEEGFILDFDKIGANLFDFSRVDELTKIGYDSTMAHIKTIKERISRTIDSTQLATKRSIFREKIPPLKFEKVIISGADSLQRKYLLHLLRTKKEEMSYEEFEKKYFILISDNKIKEIVPHAIYNKENQSYDLHLKVHTDDEIIGRIGGNISSTTSNQAYFGIRFQNLSDFGFTADIDAQLGKIYNAAGLSSRIDIPTRNPFYIKLSGVFHRFSYFEKTKWFYEDNTTTDFNQSETYIKLNVGLPITMRGRLEFGVGYGVLTDYYRLHEQTSFEDVNNDKSEYYLGSMFARIENYTLNSLVYPTDGFYYKGSLQLIGGTENFTPSSGLQTSKQNELWLQIFAQYNSYHKIFPKFTLGFLAELSYSNRELLNNYTATIIQAPIFTPTPHSKTVYNRAFSANQYVAAGIKPIFQINDQLHFRLEQFAFLPYQQIGVNEEQLPYYKEPTFKALQFLTEASLVLDLKFISIGVFGNYYSTSASKFNLGVNIGFLLFSPRFKE